MKLIQFTYTKTDGTQSDRAVIELQSPSKFMEGLDVTQMPDDEFADFAQAYRELKNAQHEATMALLAKHDLKHNYRRFIPDNMEAVTTENI
jgi:alpha-ketoglutarate-dependent taurine dioxygenase